MRRVDLGLVAWGEGLGELGAEILAAVALVVDLGLDAEAEVDVVAAFAEEMAGRAGADDVAVLDFPFRLVVGMRLPAGEVLAVEKLHPFLLRAGLCRGIA